MEKICTTCGLPRIVPDDFHRRTNGFASECKVCRSERDKVIYQENGETIRRRKLWINPDLISGNKNPICNKCGKGIEEVPFGSRKMNGVRYYRVSCKKCSNEERSRRDSKESVKIRGDRYKINSSTQRKALHNVDKWIYEDSRGSDRKKGLRDQFDLTREFIREIIADGCRYCGESDIRIGLDRIDNARGHSKDNVIPCCMRCNYIRRHMPFEAWMKIVPAIRNARECGAFGDWVGGCR